MRVRGLDLFLRDSGPEAGPPVVLLHGFPFDHTLWDPQAARLAPEFRVVAYDARAHGLIGGAGADWYVLTLFDVFVGFNPGEGDHI